MTRSRSKIRCLQPSDGLQTKKNKGCLRKALYVIYHVRYLQQRMNPHKSCLYPFSMVSLPCVLYSLQFNSTESWLLNLTRTLPFCALNHHLTGPAAQVLLGTLTTKQHQHESEFITDFWPACRPGFHLQHICGTFTGDFPDKESQKRVNSF